MKSKAQEFLGRGWGFPVGIASETGEVELVEASEDVRQAIRILVQTHVGERVMRPEYGCDIEVFESLDADTIGSLESGVRAALVAFEPRIRVLAVRVSADETVRGKVIVDIEYRLRDSNRRDNVVYAFYLLGEA